MSITEEVQKLEKRKCIASYQRKITTCLGTAIEYDCEIDAIDRRIEVLRLKLKSNRIAGGQSGKL